MSPENNGTEKEVKRKSEKSASNKKVPTRITENNKRILIKDYGLGKNIKKRECNQFSFPLLCGRKVLEWLAYICHQKKKKKTKKKFYEKLKA